MSRDDIVRNLNALIEAAKDGEFGFTACAKHVDSIDLNDLFVRRAEECREAAVELQTLVSQLGGEPDTGGTASGAIHRGWVSVKGSLAGYSDLAMLEECERAEDAALALYRAALRNDELPESVRAVVARQQLAMQAHHEQIKRLKDLDRRSA